MCALKLVGMLIRSIGVWCKAYIVFTVSKDKHDGALQIPGKETAENYNEGCCQLAGSMIKC